MWKLIAVVAALGACALDEPSTAGHEALFATSTEVAALGGAGLPVDSQGVDPGRALVELYLEMDAHLAARGVSPGEVLAAGEAGDEQRVRALLGFTDEQLEDIHARMVTIAAAAERGDLGPEPGVEDPDGPRCERELWPCAGGFLSAIFLRSPGTPVPIVVAVGVGGGLSCIWAYCRWEGSSPGSGAKKP